MVPRVLLVSARPEVEEVFLHAPPGTFTLERRSPGMVQPGECAREFGVALIDLQSATDAIALGRVLRTLNKEVEFIPLVSRADERSGIQAVTDGAFDYLLWPPVQPADAWRVLSRCLRKLAGENLSSDFKVPPDLLAATVTAAESSVPPAPWAPAPWAKAAKSDPGVRPLPRGSSPAAAVAVPVVPAVVPAAAPAKPASLAETTIRPPPVTAGSAASPVPMAETTIRPPPVGEPEPGAPLAEAVAGEASVDLVPPSMRRPKRRFLATGGIVLFVAGVAGSWLVFGRPEHRLEPAPLRVASSPTQPPAATPSEVASSTPAVVVVTVEALPRPSLATRVVRPTKGALSVWVDGWANVYVDGQKLSQAAPFVGLPVAPGKHKITLENPAKGRRDYEVTIAPGQTSVVRGAL